MLLMLCSLTYQLSRCGEPQRFQAVFRAGARRSASREGAGLLPAALEQAADAADEARVDVLLRRFHRMAPDEIRARLDFLGAVEPRLDAAQGHDLAHRLRQEAVHLALVDQTDQKRGVP